MPKVPHSCAKNTTLPPAREVWDWLHNNLVEGLRPHGLPFCDVEQNLLLLLVANEHRDQLMEDVNRLLAASYPQLEPVSFVLAPQELVARAWSGGLQKSEAAIAAIHAQSMSDAAMDSVIIFGLIKRGMDGVNAKSSPNTSRNKTSTTLPNKLKHVTVFMAQKSLSALWDGLLAGIVAQENGTYSKMQAFVPTLRLCLPAGQGGTTSLDSLLRGDQQRASLPELDERLLHDPLLGHWDAYWCDALEEHAFLYEIPQEYRQYVGRDPAQDVQQHVPVAIDFGTTSTVVALREQGRSRLLRVGVKNWREVPRPHDFENPTVLEVFDYDAFLENWQALPYRPHTQWAHMKCSHWAKAELSRDATCTTMQSGLSGLKTWARLGKKQPPLPRKDQQGQEFTLVCEDMVCRRPLEDFATAPFDPLDVYAWFLGLNMNNQHSHGGRIYHEYYMSFPVKFDKETRQRIMNSFARGLERSLPASLGLRADWREKTPFTLTEGASEPAAYAAGVLPAMGLEPTDDGLPFGVFDFGGGTTDFAIGLYRHANMQEERGKGWEQVLDMLDSSGDENLGGEHLLHHLAYAVVQGNMSKLLDTGAGLVFVMPVDGVPFAGSELLLDHSLIARTNTTKLCEALRPLWEENCLDMQETGQLSLTLFDRKGEETPLLALDVDEEALRALLRQRITQGVEAFFTTFRQALKKHGLLPQSFHILLAGNSCRSPLVREAFEAKRTAIMDGPDVTGGIILHAPLQQDMDNVYAPTLKTGVALGLLRTVPGESTGIVDRTFARNDEAPFRFAVGLFRRACLVPVLQRFDVYGEWHVLGVVRQDLTTLLGYTDSPLAMEGDVARGQCAERRITWNAGDAGKTVFLRATGPASIEVALGADAQVLTDTNTLYALTLDE